MTNSVKTAVFVLTLTFFVSANPNTLATSKLPRIINPDLERTYAKRAHSHTVEVEGASHSVYESHPKEVAKLIMEAAAQAGHQNR